MPHLLFLATSYCYWIASVAETQLFELSLRNGLENQSLVCHYTGLSACPSDSTLVSFKRHLFAFKFAVLVVALVATKNSIVG